MGPGRARLCLSVPLNRSSGWCVALIGAWRCAAVPQEKANGGQDAKSASEVKLIAQMPPIKKLDSSVLSGLKVTHCARRTPVAVS